MHGRPHSCPMLDLMTGLLLVAPLILAATGCAGPQTEQGPPAIPGGNVILVIVDALRADHVGCYRPDQQPSITPRIDQLAQHALVFDRAYSTTSITVSSTASLFTSTLFPVHRITHPAESDGTMRRLSDRFLMMPEVFHQAGYSTGLVVNRGWVSTTANYKQGVDEHIEVSRNDRAILAKAELFIADHKDDPFFLYVHLITMHDYFHPDHLFAGSDPVEAGVSPALLDLRGATAREVYVKLVNDLSQPGRLTPTDLAYLEGAYDRLLAETDQVIGELADGLKELGLADRTVLAIAADHGEQFLEHGRLVHGSSAYYQEVVHIPLIIHSPTLFKTSRHVGTPASSIDIAPTLQALVGLDTAPVQMGESLLRFINDEGGHDDAQDERVVFVANEDTWKAISPRWSLILSDVHQREELYDLAADPGETVNLAADRPEVLEQMRAAITAMQARCRAHPYSDIGVDEVEMDADQKEALRALGYVD